jgi:hypothetical protein
MTEFLPPYFPRGCVSEPRNEKIDQCSQPRRERAIG